MQGCSSEEEEEDDEEEEEEEDEEREIKYKCNYNFQNYIYELQISWVSITEP